MAYSDFLCAGGGGMKLTNKYNLPSTLVSAIANDPYEFEGDISTTGLILPPRIRQLRKRHRSKIYQDVSDNIYRLLGQNTHHILERINEPDCIKEKRYYVLYGGLNIGGQIDLYEKETRTLSDWKVTSVWSVIHGIKPEHEQQLNVNAYLMAVNNIFPIKLQVVNFLRDWSKHKVKEKDYPKCQVVVQDIPLWSFNEAEAFIEKRIKLHQEAENTPDDALLPCNSIERWEKATTYAVMKSGRKSALRVLDSHKKAEAWMKEKDKGEYIEERLGESVRCESYCECNIVCNQYLKI